MSSEFVNLKDFKKLRACTKCKLLKSESQWSEMDCDNCGPRREENLTKHFKGLVAYTNPKHSWVAKWLVSNDIKPGFYCISVDENEEDYDDLEEDNE